MARSAGGGLRAPRGLAGYSRRRPRPLLARRSEAIRPGPRLSSAIALGRRINASQSGLGSPCYHVVFTSAGGKSEPLRSRTSRVYDLLFRAAAETLIMIAADPKASGRAHRPHRHPPHLGLGALSDFVTVPAAVASQYGGCVARLGRPISASLVDQTAR